MLTRKALWGAIACLALGAVADRAEAQSVAPAAAAAEDTSTIGMSRSSANQMLIAVTVDGAGPFQFILDTASERSAIAQEVADAIGAPSDGRGRVLSLTASRDVRRVRLRDVSYGAGDSRPLSVMVLRGENIGAAGILGIDALRGRQAVLDFRTNTLTVTPSNSRAVRPQPNEIIVQGRRRLGQLILAECTIGGQPVDVIIDTGIQVSIGNQALRRLLGARRNAFTPITLLSVTGESQQAEYTYAEQFAIGGAQLSAMPVAFADAYIFERLGLTRRPALFLGMDALQAFERVSVDFQTSEARFQF